MGRKEKARAGIIYEKLRQELGDKEVEMEIEKARKDLEKLVGMRVSWEDAVLHLATKREEKTEEETEINAFIKHVGKHWKIYYYPIDSFEEDLPVFGNFLEDLEEGGEEVSAIIPNMGFVKTSIVLGTSFQGVKGFAVITKEAKS